MKIANGIFMPRSRDDGVPAGLFRKRRVAPNAESDGADQQRGGRCRAAQRKPQRVPARGGKAQRVFRSVERVRDSGEKPLGRRDGPQRFKHRFDVGKIFLFNILHDKQKSD